MVIKKKKSTSAASREITIDSPSPKGYGWASKLAEMSQREFMAIRTTMATKEGLSAVSSELREEIKSLRSELATKDDLVALRETIKSDFRETVQEIRDEVKKANYAIEIDGLRQRVRRLEEKTGISREHK